MMSGYFLYHSIGTFPDKARLMSEALASFSAVWSAEDDGQWPAALGLRHRFIEAWRAVVDAPSSSLTTAENVTAALYSLIGSLPADHLRGRRVLIAADCFPSLHFLLAKLAVRFEFTLDTVPMRPGETWVRDEDFVARWQSDVGLALLTFVTSTASHRCDVAALAAHGRAMGTLVGADITQGVGVVPFSVVETGVDFMVSSSLKWLCGASGAGVLYVKPELLSRCEPELRGWFSQENPFSWDLDKFAFARDARRFDHGTPAILASVASLPGLDWFNETGVAQIQTHNLALCRTIISEAQARNWALASPVNENERGGSVMITLPQGVQGPEVVAAMRAQGLYCDVRGQTLRLSPGVVTSSGAVGLLVNALDHTISAATAR